MLLQYITIDSIILIYEFNTTTHDRMANTQNTAIPADLFIERHGPFDKRPQHTCFLAVHPSDIGYIVGKNGSTLAVIGRETGADVQLIPYTTAYPNTPPHFSISGNDMQKRSAWFKITQMCQMNLRRQWEKSAKQSEVRNTLTIDRQDMKMVIGKNGRTIQGINKRYNIRSYTRPNEKDPKNKSDIDLTGFGPDVAAAKNHIGNIVNESMRRRGVAIDVEKQSEEMYTILKKQEDDAMIEKIVKLYAAVTVESEKQWPELHDMVKRTDPKLFERLTEALNTEVVFNERSKNIPSGDAKEVCQRLNDDEIFEQMKYLK